MKRAARRGRRSGQHIHPPAGDRVDDSWAGPVGGQSSVRSPGELPGPVAMNAPGRALPVSARAKRAATNATVPAVATRGARVSEEDARVPSTASTVAQWARIWVAMCERPELVAMAVKDDEHAREHYGCTARQLRHVRYAATTGALRRRAEELAVELPDGYIDSPATSPNLSPSE
jgi:hypothetical protein